MNTVCCVAPHLLTSSSCPSRGDSFTGVRRVGLGMAGIAQFTGNLVALGCQVDLLGDLRVVQVALDVFPALHLGEAPDGHGLPGERVKIDAIGNLFNMAQAVGILAGEYLC